MYTIGYDELASGGGTIWGTSTVKAALLTSSYVFSSAHEFVDDLTNELSGGSYSRVTLTCSRSTTVDGEVLDATDPVFATLGVAAGTPGWIIVFRDTGVDSTSPLLGAFILPGTVPDGTDYTIILPTDGLFLLGPVEYFTLPEMLTFGSGA
jgi:hypothetical protein